MINNWSDLINSSALTLGHSRFTVFNKEFYNILTLKIETYTLYCIGGELDGKIRESKHPYLNYDLWTTPKQHYYVIREHKIQGFKLKFWVMDNIPRKHSLKRAKELFVDAMVLFDEQNSNT